MKKKFKKAKTKKATKIVKKQTDLALKKIKTPKRKLTPNKKKRPRAKAPDPRQVGLIDAIGEVMSECETLAEEMQSWADNMPENKQGGDKHGEVEAAAETLNEAVSDDPSGAEDASWLNEIKITIQDPTPRRQSYSRSARLGQASTILQAVIEQLEEYDADHDADGNKIEPPLDAKTVSEREDTAKEWKDKLEEIDGNLQGVEFPGMFG